MRKIVTGHRLAIRVDDRTLLAVPPMHPDTPRNVRIQVFELVLRRQIGLAQIVADSATDAMGGVEGARARLAALISEAPHRGSVMAA